MLDRQQTEATTKPGADAFYWAMNTAVSDAADMGRLLDIAIETMLDMVPAGELTEKIDRVITLLTISRGIAEKISDHSWPTAPTASERH